MPLQMEALSTSLHRNRRELPSCQQAKTEVFSPVMLTAKWRVRTLGLDAFSYLRLSACAVVRQPDKTLVRLH